MTDRELLELAARAAGIKCRWQKRMGLVGGPIKEYFVLDDEHPLPMVWNPLTDDGDALRLAVTLNLEIVRSRITDAKLHVVSCHQHYEDVHEEKRWQWEFCEDDPLAATRRAIVRAAAELGKEEKC